MKTKKANKGEKKSQKAKPLPHCGDLREGAEMTSNDCRGEGNATHCCSMT